MIRKQSRAMCQHLMKACKLTLPLLLIAILIQEGRTAQADITFYDVFKNDVYTQTSNAQPAAATGFFATAGLSYDTTGDVVNAQVTNSGNSSPLTLSALPGNNFNYAADYSSQAAMDAAFPVGNPYNFQISGGNLGTQSATLASPSNALVSAIPYLTGTSYSQLQGLNAALSDTIGINGFSPPIGSTDAYVFMVITRQSDNAVVFDQGFLDPSTTSIFVGANTLSAGTAYNIDLDYSTRITTPNAGFGTGSSIFGFEQRTEIGFTTAAAVPEPSSIVMVLIGLGAALARFIRRHFRKSSVLAASLS